MKPRYTFDDQDRLVRKAPITDTEINDFLSEIEERSTPEQLKQASDRLLESAGKRWEASKLRGK